MFTYFISYAMIIPIDVSLRVGCFYVLYGGKKVAMLEYVTYDAPTVNSIDNSMVNCDFFADLVNSPPHIT